MNKLIFWSILMRVLSLLGRQLMENKMCWFIVQRVLIYNFIIKKN